MVRASLISLIFEKTLRLSTSAVSDATAVTLMSTDIERIRYSLMEMHEIYCNFIEVGLALWLLARLLNVAMIASAVVVIGNLSPYSLAHLAMSLIFFRANSVSDCRNSHCNCLW